MKKQNYNNHHKQDCAKEMCFTLSSLSWLNNLLMELNVLRLVKNVFVLFIFLLILIVIVY